MAELMSTDGDTPCRVEGCARPRGKEHRLCRMHRARQERHGSTDDTPWSQAPAAERFLRHVAVSSTDECWMWTGARNSQGYGQIAYEGRKLMYAHRWSYAHYVGPIPDGMFVLHSCDRRACVNPGHLRVGTHVENMADMVQRGRARGRFSTTRAAT